VITAFKPLEVFPIKCKPVIPSVEPKLKKSQESIKYPVT